MSIRYLTSLVMMVGRTRHGRSNIFDHVLNLLNCLVELLLAAGRDVKVKRRFARSCQAFVWIILAPGSDIYKEWIVRNRNNIRTDNIPAPVSRWIWLWVAPRVSIYRFFRSLIGMSFTNSPSPCSRAVGVAPLLPLLAAPSVLDLLLPSS